jgi:hypothetical protein
MSYTINLTDGTIFAVIPDGTLNTDSSMYLVGQNFENYGQYIDSNFIHLLENSANATAPLAPLTGQLWWDSSASSLKVFNGSAFKVVSSTTASATAPVSNIQGDLWYDTVNQQLKIWTGDSWLIVGPAYSALTGLSGAIVDTITDMGNNSHVVVKMYVNNVIVGIISRDAMFTPQTPISGFAKVYPGFTMASALIGGVSPVFQGTASTANNSSLLDGLSSSQFLRRNSNDSTTGIVNFLNNAGITVGSSQNLKLSVDSGNAYITESIANANIQIQVSPSGSLTTALTIDGSTGNITFTNSPTAPTPGVTTNNTQVATTAFVQSQKASPTFTGTPRAPSAAFGTNTTQIATTAFVQTTIANIPAEYQLWQGAHKFVSSSAPTSGDGADGDIWFQV